MWFTPQHLPYGIITKNTIISTSLVDHCYPAAVAYEAAGYLLRDLLMVEWTLKRTQISPHYTMLLPSIILCRCSK